MSKLTLLVEILRNHTKDYKGSIEDIYYDYKSDDDLTFDIFCMDRENMLTIENKVKKLGFQVTSVDNINGTYIVSIDMSSLVDKEKFVTELRKYKFNPNGG